MIENIFAYQNHDAIKIIINNPLRFNIELFIIIGVLFFIPNKKVINNERFLNKTLTNEVKGLAILMIVIHHLCRHTISNAFDLVAFYDLGYVGVALFLFLSGYGLTSSLINKGNDNFFLKKIFRIYIPFILMNLLWFSVDYYFFHTRSELQMVTDHIFGIIIADRNYWYIPFLIFWYIVFYFVMKLKINNKSKSILMILVSIIIVVNPIFINPRGNAFSFPFGIIVGLYKEQSMYLYSNIIKTKKVKSVFIIGLLMSIFYYIGSVSLKFHLEETVRLFYILCICIFYFFYNRTMIMEKLSLTILLMISTVMFSFSDIFTFISLSIFSLFSIVFVIIIVDIVKGNKVSVFFNFLGNISFELYLIHGALMYTYDFILYKMPIEISFIIYFVLVVFISKVLNKFFLNINKKLTSILIKY